MVIQRSRIAPESSERKPRSTRPGSLFCVEASGAFSMATPSTGANRTATNQETTSAIVTTAKSEKVYSPAELAAKPIGTKPAMVTSVRAVVMSPVPMIGWAAVIVVLLIVSSIPYFLGLLVTLPVLGHATWHLYRRIVAPA